NFLEGSQSNINEVTSNYFGHFYDSLADMVNINMNLGKFWIDPSFGFGPTGIKCSYKFLYGTISSSWNMDENKFLLRVRIPFNYSRIIHYPIIENLGFPTQKCH
ncbi:MAG: alpha-L-rhamnosidase C-terminal domain-containing protein, partial [Bacteroidales bacterium]|nr:alpha-L-rhamnosidase C-terminal domain-containing protein [Bacteroidales bacterium]